MVDRSFLINSVDVVSAGIISQYLPSKSSEWIFEVGRMQPQRGDLFVEMESKHNNSSVGATCCMSVGHALRLTKKQTGRSYGAQYLNSHEMLQTGCPYGAKEKPKTNLNLQVVGTA